MNKDQLNYKAKSIGRKIPLQILIPILIAVIAPILITKIFMKASSTDTKMILTLIEVPLLILIVNKLIVSLGINWVRMVSEGNNKQYMFFIPILGSLYQASVYADVRRETEDVNIPAPVGLLPLVGEIGFLITFVILLYNVFREGLIYQTVEVSVAFNRCLIAYIFYNAFRMLAFANMIKAFSPYTYKKGTKTYALVWTIVILLYVIFFIVQRFVPSLRGTLSSPIINIFIFVISLIILPIMTKSKMAAVGKDILMTSVEED